MNIKVYKFSNQAPRYPSAEFTDLSRAIDYLDKSFIKYTPGLTIAQAFSEKRPMSRAFIRLSDAKKYLHTLNEDVYIVAVSIFFHTRLDNTSLLRRDPETKHRYH